MVNPDAIQKESTQKGDTPADAADAVEDSTPVPTSMLARDTAMDAIAARRREELERNTPEEEPAPAEEAADEPSEEVSGEEEPAPAEAVEADPVPSVEEVTVKINGEKKVVPLTDVVAAYQKDGAADKRLQQASLVEKSLTEREQALKRREDEFDAKVRVPEAPAVDRKANVTELREAIYDGDEDALDAALEKVLPENEQPVAQPIDEAAIVAKATQKALYQIELGNAVKKFEDEYADLADNPRLSDWVDQETEVVMRDNPDMTPWEVLETAAKTVQTQVDTMLKKKDAGKELDKSERVEAKKKAQAATPPVAPAARAEIGKDAPPPPTRQGVIQQMKEARGQ